jgi:hypothetical protein
MNFRLPPSALWPALALACASAFAQTSTQGATQGQAPAASEPRLVQETPESDTIAKEPKVEHLVTEDSQVRIEETRVRGVPTSIVVKSKIRGMGSYGIQPRDPSRLPQDDHSAGLPTLKFGF